MARDPMALLRQVRQRSVEQARRDLAVCLAAAAAAAARIDQLDQAIRDDRAAHALIEDAFRFQDMLHARRAAVEAERLAAMRELREAEARSEEARAVLVASRVDAEAVTALIAERADEAAGVEARREQSELEETNRCRSRTESPPD